MSRWPTPRATRADGQILTFDAEFRKLPSVRVQNRLKPLHRPLTGGRARRRGARTHARRAGIHADSLHGTLCHNCGHVSR